jgi:uncharacterized membrane protein
MGLWRSSSAICRRQKGKPCDTQSCVAAIGAAIYTLEKERTARKIFAHATREFPMATDNPRSTVQIAGHPIHPMVIAFPIACFVLAFVSDLAFAATSNGFWATASLWLLGIGLVTAALAAVTGLVEVLGDDRVRNLSDTRLHAIGNALALLIAAFNWYWRFDHGSSVIVPTGVVLSGLVVLGLAFSGWKGGEMVFRHRVGVAD